MPSYFLKQPDGKLAVFSTVVDDFVAVGLTEAEANEFSLAEMGVGRSHTDVLVGTALRDEPYWKAVDRGDGLNRWRQATTALTIRRGIDAARIRLADMGLDPSDLPPEAIRAGIEVAT